MADVGFIGFGTQRALELPEGGQAPVAPAGRARMRFDRDKSQFEVSVDQQAYEAFGAAGGGGTTVADIAALSALDDATFAEGVNVAVASVRDVFELAKTSTLVADGITVVATASGTGRWVRRELPSEVWARQAIWFIDPVGAGDDENDGSAAGTPLATWAEYARRVGELETIAQTVTIVSDPNEELYRVRGKHPGGLTVAGVATVLDAGTFDAVTNWDSTVTPVQAGQFTDAAQDFTGREGTMVRATDGAAAGNVAWILQVGPGAAGSDTVRVSQWFDPFTFSRATPSAGDSYEVVEHTEVTGEWDVQCRDLGAGSFLAFRDITVAAPTVGFHGLQPVQGHGGLVGFQRAKMTAPTNTSARSFDYGQLEFYGSLVERAQVRVRDGTILLFASALRDAAIEATRARIFVTYNNPAQVVAGGDYDQDDVMTLLEAKLLTGGNTAPLGSSFGALDLSVGGIAAVHVGSFSEIRRDASGRYWTINQAANTIGVEIEAYGLCSWEPGSVCADGYDLDVGGAGIEFVVGTTTTDAATLAAAGTIDAATNAGAVRRALS